MIGCFGLTEPIAGSDPASMLTTAVRDGDEWVIDGAKRWIGLASIADVAVIWAKITEGIRGFVVYPHRRPGHRHRPAGCADTKMNHAQKARQVCLDARDILGGNGLLIEHHVARHLTDMEVVHTYEGTDSIQALIVGRDLTGTLHLAEPRGSIATAT